MQVIAIEETFKHRVTNVVFMGMGEPLMNLSAVLPAHRTLNKVCNNPLTCAVMIVLLQAFSIQNFFLVQ